jgi:hypothetical protein
VASGTGRLGAAPVGRDQDPARRAPAAIASALYDLGDGAGAGQYAQAAMSGDIADLEGYDAVVRVLAKTGRDDLARAALQRAPRWATPRPKASAPWRAWPPGWRWAGRSPAPQRPVCPGVRRAARAWRLRPTAWK